MHVEPMNPTDLSVSDRALVVLEWLCDVERDSRRRASLLTGMTLAAQACIDGVAQTADEFAPLLLELQQAGYVSCDSARNDQ